MQAGAAGDMAADKATVRGAQAGGRGQRLGWRQPTEYFQRTRPGHCLIFGLLLTTFNIVSLLAISFSSKRIIYYDDPNYFLQILGIP